MSDLEKINIFVPEQISRGLDYDAAMFEIVKKDGNTINRNKFLSLLLLGYYNAYVTECQSSYEKIVNELTDQGIPPHKTHEIADRVLKRVVLPEIPPRKGKNPSRLSLKPTKDTEGLILDLENHLSGGDYVSQFFCRMIMSYCQKPFSEREQIVFRDNFELLQEACEQRKPISFSITWTPQRIHTVIPYKLAVGPEELFNYLVCVEKDAAGEQEAKSFRLNRISQIHYRQGSNHIDEHVQQHLNQMLFYGPQYPIHDNEESCVKLSNKGRISFSRIYFGRPQVDRIEEKPDGYYYYFKCSKEQVFFYFRRFGSDDAEIISPEPLRQKMIEFHLQAFENYRR